MKIFITGLLALVCTLYTAGLAWLWFSQEKLLFAPTALAADALIGNGKDVREVKVAVPGALLSVLHMQLPQPKGVVFFLHGNAGNVVSWFPDPDFYRRANFDVVMMDYRGYGKSTGQITSEDQLRGDVRAVWQHFAPQYTDKKWLLIGRSLGTALAAGLAAELGQSGRAPDATILVSAYQSMEALATARYRLVPSMVLRYPLRTDASVGLVRSPLLLVHGQADTLIAPNHSQALHALAPQSSLLLVPVAAHNDLQDFPAYLQAIEKVMAGL